MKVAVLGAGAMGCLYGGLLAEGGHEVWLLDLWAEHIEAIKEKGINITGISGNKIIKNINASVNPDEAGLAELVIIFVKAINTKEAMEGAMSLVGENTAVLTLQNGLGNIEKLSEVIGSSKVLAGVSAHGSTMLGPGRIKHAGTGETRIGELNGETSQRLVRIAETFNMAHIPTEIGSNIIGSIWGKLMANVGINALTALTGLQNGRLLEFRETEELLELAVLEASELADKKGIYLDIDPVGYAKQVCRLTSGNRSSMLQDVMNERKTEIDVINGAVVKEAESHGLCAPVNKVLTNLVAVIEKTYGQNPAGNKVGKKVIL